LLDEEKYFVDTGAWIALHNPKDKYHLAAKSFFNELKGKFVLFITSDYIIDESITYLRMHVSYAASVTFKNSIDDSRVVKLELITDFIRDQAWDIFLKYTDQVFSFTDCTSFALMKNLGLGKAFTFDNHFYILGFECVPYVPTLKD